jgi:hypothetical protein
LTRTRLIGLGVGAALAVALPAALVAQLADAVDDGEGTPGIAYPLFVVVLLGMAVGGWVIGRRTTEARLLLAGITGLAAIAVIQAIGAGRRAVAEEDIAWASMPVIALVAIALATGAAALAGRQPGRTRS